MNLSVELVYASETHQELIRLEIKPGTTVLQAIEASGLKKIFPEIIASECQLGIYSKKVSADTILQNNDRVEIYRPLKISPKEARLLRAKLAKKK